MNCYQFCHDISHYLDAELSFTRLKSFREHASACAPCAEILAQMESTRVALVRELPTSLSPDFVPRLQARLRSEIGRAPSRWRPLLEPRILGFSPISLSGLAAAALALLVIGVSLFQPETAPLVDPPRGAANVNPPAMIVPHPAGVSGPAAPLLTTTPTDTTLDPHDSTSRDFSRRIKYVNQSPGPE